MVMIGCQWIEYFLGVMTGIAGTMLFLGIYVLYKIKTTFKKMKPGNIMEEMGIPDDIFKKAMGMLGKDDDDEGTE